MKIPMLPVVFALGTALCWGLYGPTLGKARVPGPDSSPFKPYVGIGVAYIVWAFLGGILVMWLRGDSFTFAGKQADVGIWGFAAGTLGAFGALCLTSAMMSFNGPPKAQLVMPIVFGGAVSITAVVSTIQHRGEGSSPWMWIGIVGVVVSIVLVAYNTPHGHAKKPEATPSGPAEAGDPAAH